MVKKKLIEDEANGLEIAIKWLVPKSKLEAHTVLMAKIKRLLNNKPEPEYILCAAIWYKDFPVLEILNSNLLPINCARGIVFCGHRHPHCIRQLNVVTNKKQSEVGEYVQGFLTNKNRFVDRKEGLAIADKAGQLNDRVTTRTQLYSEDLY